MTSTITKTDSPQRQAEPAPQLFDDWFDPIETAVRDRAREFIEDLIRSELDAVLARPRYEHSKKAGDDGAPGVTGHRHGSRRRSLTGTFGPIEIAVRAPAEQPAGQDDGMEEPSPAGLSAPHLGRRRADRRQLPCRHQHAPGAPRARRPVRRRGRQGHGEPDLAQGEERLGRLEHPFAVRRADRSPHPRRHGGAGAARPQSDRGLAARRSRRARRRAEGAAGDQKHGRRERRGLARRARRSGSARTAGS